MVLAGFAPSWCCPLLGLGHLAHYDLGLGFGAGAACCWTVGRITLTTTGADLPRELPSLSMTSTSSVWPGGTKSAYFMFFASFKAMMLWVKFSLNLNNQDRASYWFNPHPAWYRNNASGSSEGTSTHPFTTLAAASTACCSLRPRPITCTTRKQK